MCERTRMTIKKRRKKKETNKHKERHRDIEMEWKLETSIVSIRIVCANVKFQKIIGLCGFLSLHIYYAISEALVLITNLMINNCLRNVFAFAFVWLYVWSTWCFGPNKIAHDNKPTKHHRKHFIPWKYCGRTASFKLEPVTFSVYLMKYDIRILVLRCEIISAAAVCIAMQCKANSFR